MALQMTTKVVYGFSHTKMKDPDFSQKNNDKL